METAPLLHLTTRINTIVMPHLDGKYYMDHLDECGLKKQVQPYTVDKISFFIKSSKPVHVISMEGCRTCNKFYSSTAGSYGTNHLTSIQFPDGLLESTIADSYKEIAKRTSLCVDSVIYDVLVLVDENRIGKQVSGHGFCALANRHIEFNHLYVDAHESSIPATEEIQSTCTHLLSTYASKLETMLQDDTYMKMLKIFQSWKDDVSYAHQKFNGCVESYMKLYRDYWTASDTSLNEMRIVVIKHCLAHSDSGLFYIGISYRLLKELIDLFQSCKNDDSTYDEVSLKKLLETRLDPTVRGHKIREPTERQIEDLQKKIGTVIVKTLPIWRLQDIIHFPLSNDNCTSLNPNQKFTIKLLAEMQLKFKIKANSAKLCTIIEYDMDEECQAHGTKHLYRDTHDSGTYLSWGISPDEYYDVRAIIPLGRDLNNPTNFLFVLPAARPASTPGWYHASYLHHSIHDKYARAFGDIRTPLKVLDGEQISGLGSSVTGSYGKLVNTPEIKIGNLMIKITHSGY